MLWPNGPLTDLAMLSRRIWLEVLKVAELPFVTDGSLHLGSRFYKSFADCPSVPASVIASHGTSSFSEGVPEMSRV